MKSQRRYTQWYRRKREGKTDYRLRLRLLESRHVRLVVRPSISGIMVQFVAYSSQGDKVHVTAHSRQLRKSYGWLGHGGNLPAAYLVGYLAGLQALKKGIRHAVCDFGLFSVVPGSRFFAVVQGVLDAGVTIPVQKEVLPSPERLLGAHVVAYAQHASRNPILFSLYRKKGLNLANFSHHVEQVKETIHKTWK